MLNTAPFSRRQQYGVTLIEVLITIVILAFGLLGLAGLQSKLDLGMMESYQRAQAIVLVTNLSERMTANRANAADYVSANTIGTGDSWPQDCSTVTAGAQRDLCEWSNALKGAAETKSSANVGAMTSARGCVTEVQAPNPTSGICTPGIYRITVTWQGLHKTKAPSVACSKDLYGDDSYRRAISTNVSVGLPSCS
jgi:type IV pilus assembly protein PilV